MNGIFGLESPFIRGLTKLADLVILNIVFIVTCIPIFTIGAGITSMYEVTLKMVKNEESYILKGYLNAFKSNFKKSTIIWLGFLVVLALFILDIFIANQMEGDAWGILRYVIIMFTLYLWAIVGFLFPLMAKFENTVKNSFKNACLLSIKHLPTTFVVTIFNSVFLACLVVSSYTFVYGIMIYTIIGFAVISYLNSIFLVRVFEKYYEKPEVK